MVEIPSTVMITSEHFDDAWYEIMRNIRLNGVEIRASPDRDVMTKDMCATVVLYGDAIKEIYDGEMHPDVPMKEGLELYIDQFVFDSPEYLKSFREQPYTYASRLKEQIGNLMAHELIQPYNRRCVIHTWRQCADQRSENPPCLQMIQIRVLDDNKKCEAFLMWRSHDACAWSWNLVAIMGMLKRSIFDVLGLECVKITEFNSSLHLYDYDYDRLMSVKKQTRFLSERDKCMP